MASMRGPRPFSRWRDGSVRECRASMVEFRCPFFFSGIWPKRLAPEFNGPFSAATLLVLSAQAGTIYVAEEGSRELNLYDQVTHQFLGTLVGPNAPVKPIGIPYGMTQTTSGFVFIADAGGDQVLEFKNRQFVQSIQAGTGPQGVVVGPGGNLVVSHFNGDLVSFEFGNGYDESPTSQGVYSTVPGARAGMVFNSAGELFISTSPNGSAIYKVPAGGGAAAMFSNQYLPYPYGNSRGMAFLPDGDLLVADAGWEGTGLLYRVNAQGRMTPFITNLGGSDYVGVNEDDQTIYIAEYSSNIVSEYTFTGEFVKNVLTDLNQPGVLMVVDGDDLSAPEPASVTLCSAAMVLCALKRRNLFRASKRSLLQSH